MTGHVKLVNGLPYTLHQRFSITKILHMRNQVEKEKIHYISCYTCQNHLFSIYKQDHKLVTAIKIKCLYSLEDVCICQFKLSLKQDRIDNLKHPLTQLIQLHNGACYCPLYMQSSK